MDNDYSAVNSNLISILNNLRRNDERIVNLLKPGGIVNAFGDDPASGIVTVQNPLRNPIRITDIIATWAITTPSQATTVGVNPAAGANYVYTNASGVPQILNSINGLFTAGAGVANRTIGVVIKDAAGNILAIVQDATPVVASTSATLNAFQGATQQNAASGVVILPLPTNIVIPPNGTVTLQATNIQAADTWTAITLATTNQSTPNASATLKLGGRTFQLPYSAGQFQALGMADGLEMDNTSNANTLVLTIVPGAAAHLEFSGEVDERKLERM